MDKALYAVSALSLLGNIILCFLWRADYKAAQEAKSWKAVYASTARKLAETKWLLAKKELELRNVEKQLSEAQPISNVVDELNKLS